MSVRKLRLAEKSSTPNIAAPEASAPPTERKLHVLEPALCAKADRLLSLKTSLAAKEQAFKQETEGLKAEISGLQRDLLAYGKESGLPMLSTDLAQVVFTSRTSRKINPESFLAFLRSHGRTKSFYDFVDVPLTNAIKAFGEAVLESSGVLMASVEEYAGVKVHARHS